MTDFFTADTHFGHARAIQMNSRPFADAAEMREVMIQRWNAVVQPTDTVWHLGDFDYRCSDADATAVFNRLNGRKHLIVGNHDGDHTVGLGWSSVSANAEIYIDKTRAFLSHYPHLEWPGYWRQSVHLFGHVHGNRQGVGRSIDVGVDVWDFRPVRLAEILSRLEGVENG